MRPIDEVDIAVLRVVEGLRTAFEWVPMSSVVDKLPYPRIEVERRARFLEKAALVKYRYIGHYREFALMILERGFDTLALWDFKRHGILEEVGDTIGEGKEAEIVLARSPSGEPVVIKFHRYWAKEFRHIRRSLSYAAVVVRGQELNLEDSRIDVPRAKAQVEMKALEAVHKAGVSTPEPLGVNRHAVAMRMVEGEEPETPAPNLSDIKLKNPREALEQITSDVETMVREAGFIHGDLNEYNILVDREGVLYYIDFPQAVPVSYEEAQLILERDLENIFSHFRRKYRLLDTPSPAQLAEDWLFGS